MDLPNYSPGYSRGQMPPQTQVMPRMQREQLVAAEWQRLRAERDGDHAARKNVTGMADPAPPVLSNEVRLKPSMPPRYHRSNLDKATSHREAAHR